MPAAIEIESLSKTYTKEKQGLFIAVDKVNLTIPHGQVFGFLGPNGAGKTTTIKMICNLILPTTGSIKLNGYDVHAQRRMAMQQIGAVLEGNRNVYWQLSAWENLIYFGRLKGLNGSVLTHHITTLLYDLELWDVRHEPVGLLSRGSQQKVAIASTLSANPPIILFDEPTLGLDIKATRTIKGWIKELASKYKKTIVITTHQLDIAEYLCDQVGIMNHGSLIVNLPTQELLNTFKHERYEIKIETTLSPEQHGIVAQFPLLHRNGCIVLEVEGQEALHDTFALFAKQLIPIISIKRAKHNLEEIFVHLMNQTDPSPLQKNAPLYHTRMHNQTMNGL